jgi:hypothetical protein
MIPPWLYEDLEGLVDDVSVGDELAVFLPEDGADAFWVGFNLLELKSDVVDIRNYTNSTPPGGDLLVWQREFVFIKAGMEFPE